MNTFVIADTHFGHARIVEFTGRPEDFDARIIANWNAVVGPDDLVIHLGDVAFGRGTDVAALMACLHGRKILCLGNHDREKPEWYMVRGFAFACAWFVYHGVAFSHKPVTPLPPGCLFNLHGHFHRDDHRDREYADNAYYHRHRNRYRLVEIESTLAPVPLAALLDRPRHDGSVEEA
jgi:calcineurin-like phosphoesterase family protein